MIAGFPSLTSMDVYKKLIMAKKRSRVESLSRKIALITLPVTRLT